MSAWKRYGEGERYLGSEPTLPLLDRKPPHTHLRQPTEANFHQDKECTDQTLCNCRLDIQLAEKRLYAVKHYEALLPGLVVLSNTFS